MKYLYTEAQSSPCLICGPQRSTGALFSPTAEMTQVFFHMNSRFYTPLRLLQRSVFL